MRSAVSQPGATDSTAIPAQPVDDEARMINEHLALLGRRTYGITATMMKEYGLTERELTDISVEWRSGFHDRARQALRDALKSKRLYS
jgi:hypothetical protein